MTVLPKQSRYNSSNRDDLKNFLRPFAQEGREVAAVDVHRFFAARMEAARVGQK